MRKTNDEIILKMTEEGKSQKEIAEYFQVSPAAICKRLKRLAPMPESFKDLTEKEKRFCLEVASGQTKTAAALASYECGSRESAKALGFQLTKRDDINLAIRDIMDEEQIGRRHRIRALKRHIDNEHDAQASLKGIDIANKMDGSYIERHAHIHLRYEDLKQEQAECRDGIVNSDRNFKEYYIAEIKKLHPEMDDDTVSEMAVKTLNALFPERENLNFLGSETIEGEIIKND